MSDSETCRDIIPSLSLTHAGAVTEHCRGPWLVPPWAAGGHAVLRRKRRFLCRPERRVLPCLAPSLPARAQCLGQAQDGSSVERGGCWGFQPGKCLPGQGGQGSRVPASRHPWRRAGAPMGETRWGGACAGGVIYSTPSLCPIARSPTSP